MAAVTSQQVEALFEQRPVEEQWRTFEHLLQRMRLFAATQPPRPPRDLYGLWHGPVPEDFDVDAALQEIRCGTKKDQTLAR